MADSTKQGSSETKTVTEQVNRETNVVINARVIENERRPRVTFTQDTVDNEGMGRKSSKGNSNLHSFQFVNVYQIVCCIYKKPKAFGESSSESDSSDDDVSPYERKPKAMKNKKHKKCNENCNDTK